MGETDSFADCECHPALAVAFAAHAIAQNPPAGNVSRAPAAAASDQRYRYRLLGVYNDATGDPIAGADITDMVNGVSSATSATGTLSLLFLPNGGGLVRIRKLGCEV